MNAFDQPRNSEIEEQASLWAARLDGSTLPAAERAELDAWLAADSAHRVALSQYCQFSADLEEQLLALLATGGLKLPPEPAAVVPMRRSRKWQWASVVSLAAAASIALGVWFTRPGHSEVNYSTPAAQRQSLTLADGTRVELNARTSLVVENGHAERRVRLAAGEACFTVSKDKQRPFVVETPSGSVRVTGTIFDVRTDGNAILEVTVVEGSVQVHRKDLDSTLGAGDRLSVSPSGVATARLDPSAVDDTLAWRQGQIVCTDMSLREATERFSYYNGRRIEVSPEAAGLLVGGRHSLDDPDNFFAALKVMFPDKTVSVTYDPSGTAHIDVRSDR